MDRPFAHQLPFGAAPLPQIQSFDQGMSGIRSVPVTLPSMASPAPSSVASSVASPVSTAPPPPPPPPSASVAVYPIHHHQHIPAAPWQRVTMKQPPPPSQPAPIQPANQQPIPMQSPTRPAAPRSERRPCTSQYERRKKQKIYPVHFPAHVIPPEIATQNTEGQPLPQPEEIQSRRYATSVDERNFLTVFEYTVNEKTIIWDYFTGYVHLTGIWKAIGNSKADIVKLLDNSPELEPVLKRVRGGFLKIQGTWVPFDIARQLAQRVCYRIRYSLIPLFGPNFPNECLQPHESGFGQLHLGRHTQNQRHQPFRTMASGEYAYRAEPQLQQQQPPPPPPQPQPPHSQSIIASPPQSHPQVSQLHTQLHNQPQLHPPFSPPQYSPVRSPHHHHAQPSMPAPRSPQTQLPPIQSQQIQSQQMQVQQIAQQMATQYPANSRRSTDPSHESSEVRALWQKRRQTKLRARSTPHSSRASLSQSFSRSRRKMSAVFDATVPRQDHEDEWALESSDEYSESEDVRSPPPMPRKLSFKDEAHVSGSPNEFVEMLQATRSLQLLSAGAPTSKWPSTNLGGGFECAGRYFHWDGSSKLDVIKEPPVSGHGRPLSPPQHTESPLNSTGSTPPVMLSPIPGDAPTLKPLRVKSETLQSPQTQPQQLPSISAVFGQHIVPQWP